MLCDTCLRILSYGEGVLLERKDGEWADSLTTKQQNNFDSPR